MKNFIVFLFLLLLFGNATAQFPILPVNTNSIPYRYQVLNNYASQYPWAENDLITWIFPDGQYMKSSIHYVNGQLQGDMIEWRPSAYLGAQTSLYTAPHDIQAFVTKKGGTGTPPPLLHVFTDNQALPNTTINYNNSPVTFGFPNNATWQVNRTWDLSPQDETFLLVSYNPAQPGGCALPTVDESLELSFDASKLMLVDYYGFNMENIVPYSSISTTSPPDRVIINHFYYSSPTYRHVMLKVKPLAALHEAINITAKGTFCGQFDSIVLPYTVEAFPHDPNKKIVDIDTIHSYQTGAVKLTYTVQFQNDGNAHAQTIKVEDNLPVELNPATFALVNVPTMNGIGPPVNFPNSPNTNALKSITFSASQGSPGLPGLNQTNPSYGYGQTIYRYKFEVYTYPNIKKNIDNVAGVTFYQGSQAFPQVITNLAQVYCDDPQKPVGEPNCNCWKKFWRRFCHIFRHEKMPPDK